MTVKKLIPGCVQIGLTLDIFNEYDRAKEKKLKRCLTGKEHRIKYVHTNHTHGHAKTISYFRLSTHANYSRLNKCNTSFLFLTLIIKFTLFILLYIGTKYKVCWLNGI